MPIIPSIPQVEAGESLNSIYASEVYLCREFQVSYVVRPCLKKKKKIKEKSVDQQQIR